MITNGIDLDSMYDEYLEVNDIQDSWTFENNLGDYENILGLLPKKCLSSFYEFTPEEIIENILRYYEVLNLIKVYNFDEKKIIITLKNSEDYYKFETLIEDLEDKDFICKLKYD